MSQSPNFLKVRSAVRESVQLLEAGDCILVAVSGGADSLALAAAVAIEGKELALKVIGATVDHQLQKNSGAQAQEVAVQLNGLGIESTEILEVDVEIVNGMEASARTARYQALSELAARVEAKYVLLGHTRDDQAESVLLGLARGSGTRSLSAMAEVNGIYLRPLLSLTREESVGACKELGLKFWNDPHNEDTSYTRVRVRKSVLPVIESELGPGISAALARSAALLRDDADALDALAEEVFVELPKSDVEIAPLELLPRAIRTRVLRSLIYRAGAPSGTLTAEHVAAVEALITAWHGQGEVSLPGNVKVGRISGRLSLSSR